MKTCQTHQMLLDKHLEGTLAPGELAELEAHAAVCPACRAEVEARTAVQDVIQDALLPRTAPANAAELIQARIAGEAKPEDSRRSAWGAWLDWASAAITGGGGWRGAGWRIAGAGALLAIGFGLGLWLNQAGLLRSAHALLSPRVAMEVATFEGTVLVKHLGSELWQPMRTNSPIHLGDTFHCAAKSGLVLRMPDQSVLALRQNSLLVLRHFQGGTQLDLEQGQLSANLNSPHPPFVISTPHGRVEALGTEFTVTVE
jgi:hypothetical protein